MKILAISTLMTLSLALLSCAANRNVPKYNELLQDVTGQNGRACVRTSDIDGYGVLAGNVVSIDGGFNYYLATVLPGCMDLNTSVAALFSSDFGEVCGQSMDRMYTGGDRCIINHMYKFENRDEAFAAYNQAREQREQIREKKQRE